jgi:hypothetical protein
MGITRRQFLKYSGPGSASLYFIGSAAAERNPKRLNIPLQRVNFDHLGPSTGFSYRILLGAKGIDGNITTDVDNPRLYVIDGENIKADITWATHYQQNMLVDRCSDCGDREPNEIYTVGDWLLLPERLVEGDDINFVY